MNRTLPHFIGVLVFAALVSGEQLESRAHQKAVNVATSAFPVRIAVLSDGYSDENEFDFDVQHLIANALLMHPSYAPHQAALEIASFYYPPPAASQSNYGFNVEVPSGNCVLSWVISDDDSNTATRINAAVEDFNPTHTIVIGDHPYNIGCSDGDWTYVARGISGTDVLPHELGHGLASLYDEWFFESNRGVPHPGIAKNLTRNCYDTRHGTPPPWQQSYVQSQYPGAGSYQGCDFYELDVVHAYPPHYGGHNYCLMGATQAALFCPVCQLLMQQAFDPPNPDIDNPDVQNPPQQRPAPPANLRIVKIAYQQPAPGTVKPAVQPVTRPIIRLVAAFDPVSGSLRPKKAIAVTARYTSQSRRLGEYAYEIIVNGRTYVGVLPSSLFRSHSYQGGVVHQSSPPHETDITLQIPDATEEMIRSGKLDLAIRIFRLGPTVTQQVITPSALAGLRKEGQAEQRGAVITAKDLLNVM